MTRVLTGIEYANIQGSSLLLDIYLPQGNPRSCPTIVYLHGGAWVMGNRSDYPERLQAMAAQGIAVVSIDYRLAPAGRFPAQIEDIAAALEWLGAEGGRYGLRTDKFAIWGASAGAHLAAFAALAGASHASPVEGLNVPLRTICAALLWFGRYDLTLATPAPTGTRPPALARYPRPSHLPQPMPPTFGISQLVGKPYDLISREELMSLSPITYASPSAPAVLMVHGIEDSLVPLSQSERLHETLQKGGGTSRVLAVAGANHEDDLFVSDDVMGQCADFVLAAFA